ncbi:DUF927 domain-containing protein, partial [Burkholderia pseudomallei]|uniref:DUF927 domain-containing protein n=1 Tax=Burkholderia pseudomallei TaxID=28450 RepID=UPI00126A60D6
MADALSIHMNDGRRIEFAGALALSHFVASRAMHLDPLPPHWVSTRIDVIAETRNEMNSEWGYLLEFTDRD